MRIRWRRKREPITDPVTGEVYTEDDIHEIGQDIMRTLLHGGGFDDKDATIIRKRLAKET